MAKETIKEAWCDKEQAIATGRRTLEQAESNVCCWRNDCSRCCCCVVETYEGSVMTGPESHAAKLWLDDK